MDTLKLSKTEMKKVFGGVLGNSSTCTVTCDNGTSISITCNGSCTATTGVSVGCTGGTYKYCPGKNPNEASIGY